MTQSPTRNFHKTVGEIGVYDAPTTTKAAQAYAESPTKQQRASSPFRMAKEQQVVIEPGARTSAFQSRQLQIKVKPQLDQEVAVVDLQSTTSLINTTMTMKQQNVVEQDHSFQSEILHYMADPQILVNFVTPPGELPRSIALERRRRAVANVDFLAAFKGFTQRAETQSSKLPLELFDDDTFETKSLNEFFRDAKRVQIYDANRSATRDVKGLYGDCYLNKEWQKCVVIGQKPQKEGQPYDDRLLVITRDQKQQKFWVPRLFVYIWGEDSNVYLNRLENALHQRELKESLIKYEECVNNMPSDNLLGIDTETSKIIKYLREDKQFSGCSGDDKENVEKAIQKNYLRAQNEILFQLSLQQQPSLITELGLELAVSEKQAKNRYDYDNEWKVVFPYWYMLDGDAQLRGQAPDYKFTLERRRVFDKNLADIKFDCLLTSVEAIQCLQLVSKELYKLTEERPTENYAANRVFFEHAKVKIKDLTYDYRELIHSIYFVVRKMTNAVHPFSIKTYSLDEFKQLQTQQQDNIQQFLEQTFINTLKFGLIGILKQAGKGHFNIDVKSIEVYMQSKLRRLLKCISLQLCDAFRDLCEESTRQFVQMFYFQSLWEVDIGRGLDVKNVHEDNKSKSAENGACVYRQPIFSINLSAQLSEILPSDKDTLEKLNKQYIKYVCPIKEEPIELDEAEDDQKGQEEQQGDDEEGSNPEEATEAPAEAPKEEAKKEDAKGAAGKRGKKAQVPMMYKIGYQTNPGDFIGQILQIYDAGFAKIAKVPSIEFQVLTHLERNENQRIATPNLQEEQFVEQREALTKYLEKILEPLEPLKQQFYIYNDLLLLDEEKWADTVKYKAELYLQQQNDAFAGKKPEETQSDGPQITPLSPQDLNDLIQQQKDQKRDIQRNMPEAVHCGSFIVRTFMLKNMLINKCDGLIAKLQDIVFKIASSKQIQINKLYFAINRKLTKKSMNIENVCQLENFTSQRIDALIAAIQQNIGTMNQYYDILERLYLNVNNNQFAQKWKTQAVVREIKHQLEKTLKVIAEDKVRYKDEMIDQQSAQSKSLETLQRQIMSFSNRYTKLDQFNEAYEEVTQNIEQLDRLIAKGQLFNKREGLLGIPATDYSQLLSIKKDFGPIQTIWKCYYDFYNIKNDVFNKDFKQINAQKVETVIDESSRAIMKAIRSIPEDQEKTKELANTIKQNILDFKQQIPLLSYLRNPGLRKRHWMRMSRECDVDLSRLRYINGIELKKYGSSSNTDDNKSEVDYTELTAEQIQELNDKPVNFTFKQAITEYGLEKHFEIIKNISEGATKEYAIEQILNKVEEAWANTDFTVAQYQDQDAYIIKSVDDIMQLLDDNINLIQSMSASSFKVFFQELISSWDYKLSLTSEIIDVWIQVQQAWLYLEPIFSSEDIQRQLVNETNKFKSSDQFYRKFMLQVSKKPNVIQTCVETDKLLQKFRDNYKILEQVQKGLSNYLETKRIAFPRFFFLSDEELLSILSNTKNPTSVQPFLRSCFENINRIKFIESENYKMVSMTSHEGEIVEFATPLTPQGQVEQWMGQLEKLCIQTIKLRTCETLAKYLQAVYEGDIRGRAEWVKCGFAQGVNLVNQMTFCNDTEWAIRGGTLKDFMERLKEQLICMTDLVRTGLNKLESKVFSALLTYDVFQRDVVEGLIQSRVTSVDDFEWSKHPKHVCNIDDFYLYATVGKDVKNDPEYDKWYQNVFGQASKLGTGLLVSYKQIMATLPYQFEYLGNTQRLVITPLTLKIYSTNSQAQGMFKFVACSGPAGSGKTETSKQYTNKELGLVCIVFNCSEGLDLIGIRRMLSGVISSGGCLIMDEINRLSLDVLSVFAQMVLGVQRGLQLCGGSIVKNAELPHGKQMGHIQTTKIVFEGAELNLQSTAVVIITQNPNYSGRQKLPANLVALFRAVSVMVPNYNKICQIRLYSFGFKKATSLAQKAVSVFKLCSEQLSQQSWYDYGMRAINSTIQAAGNIRQQLGQFCVEDPPDGDARYYTEDQIVLRAVSEVNSPKFLPNDAFLFENILKDLFPGVKKPFIDYNTIIKELQQVLRSNYMNYMQPDEVFVAKIVDLYMTINLRHGLMTLGAANSGKSVSLYVLMETMNRLNKREVDERLEKFNKILKSRPKTLLKDMVQHIPEDYNFMRYFITRMNPKSITMDQLFGQFDPVSKEWQDGVLSTCVRNAVADYNKYMQYVEDNLYVGEIADPAAATISDVNPDVYVQKCNFTRQLVLCDGYMDSLWIESLNTVLDDSKRLCLTSGEIICLTPVMNMVFNMDSVAEASPATISRNGMLYYTTLDLLGVNSKSKTDPGQIVESGTVSLNAYIQSFIDNLSDQLRLQNPPQGEQQITSQRVFQTKYGIEEEYSEIAKRLLELSKSLLAEGIAISKLYGKQLQETCDAGLVLSFYKFINTFIGEVKPNDFGIIEGWQKKLLLKYLDHIILYSLVWAVGGTLGDEESRRNFDEWLRSKWGSVSKVELPTELNGQKVTVFDLELIYRPYDEIKAEIGSVENQDDYLNQQNMQFQTWGQQMLAEVSLDTLFFGEEMRGKVTQQVMSGLNINDVIIPCRANIQQTNVLQRLISNGLHSLVVGNTGSGKTSVIKNYLLRHKTDTLVNIPLLFNFSANTQAGEVQQYLDQKVEKRKRGVFGPPVGKKLVFYGDDLNMPAKERYGCINSHELVRQVVAHGGYFDLKELYFKQIVETYVVSSMCPPGGARNPVTQRLVRHFVVQNFLEMDGGLLKEIFGSIVSYWSGVMFDGAQIGEELANSLKSICDELVPMGIEIYGGVRAGLLPTPAKTHYTYNLRDLSKLVSGLLMVDANSLVYLPQEKKTDPLVARGVKEARQEVVKLFLHENLRVFSDRLIDSTDEEWFENMLLKTVKEKLPNDIPDNVTCKDLIFGDFVTGKYQNLPNQQEVVSKIVEALGYYNESHANEPMNLVLFKSAIQHLCRIVRILRQPGSNILVIGVGGVGRNSLTRLGSSLLNYDIFTINMKKNYGLTEWHTDIKDCLLQCGLQGKQQVFLIQDQHIFTDRQFEDISILLNSCDVQNYYEQADMEKIYTEMKPYCVGQQTKLNLYDAYLNRVKANLHVVLCMSPSGSQLRTRLRKFPSLVNCCSIDYILDWPEEALVNVGKQVYQFVKSEVQMVDPLLLEFLTQFITDYSASVGKDVKDVQEAIIQYCVKTHAVVTQLSATYRRELNRKNHVTPTLYLNLLQMFLKILQQNYIKINTYRTQLSNGLDQLQSAEQQVAKLTVELQDLQPELEKKSEMVKQVMEQLKIDNEAANETRDIVTEEKKKTSAKVEECKAIEKNASEKLADGNVQLEGALKALDALQKNDFVELQSYKNPPAAVLLVLNAAGTLLQLKSKKVTGADGKPTDDYFDSMKAELVKPDMIPSLKNFDKEHIPDPVIQKIKPYIQNDQFDPNIIVGKSKVCAGLCMWVHAMYKYHFINLEVQPLRIEQKKAETELAEAQEKLAEATQKLNETEAKIDKLKKDSEETMRQQKQIQTEVENTQQKLKRADILISSLQGEKLRWQETLVSLAQQIKCLLGDSLYAATFVIYSGAFTAAYRQILGGELQKLLQTYDIGTSQTGKIEVTTILSDNVTLMNYVNQHKLPSDYHSRENAAMLFTSTKYCLLVDPERQAQQFLKNYYRDVSVEIVKHNDKDLVRTLENSIRFGKIMIVTGLQQEIDVSLLSIMDQTIIKDSGQPCYRLNEALIPLNPAFRLYLVTNLANPDYAPEQFVKATVLNFGITMDGLQDQLLGQVVALERPDQESLKNSLMVSNARMKMELKALEAKVLELLASNEGDILDNLTLIDTLSMSQKTSAEIQQKVAESEKTEAEIDQTRLQYVPMAKRGALLYFCLQDLQSLEFMYQYSLSFFTGLYVTAIQQAEQDPDVQVRLKNLIGYFTFFFYSTICRSLFESHKLLFALLISFRIDLTQPEQFRLLNWLLVGGGVGTASVSHSEFLWLPEASFNSFLQLTQFQEFADVFDSLRNDKDRWLKMYEAHDPEMQEFPGKFGQMSLLEKFLLVKALRSDRVTAYARIYIAGVLGAEYNQPQVFNLDKSFKDSTNIKPLLFLLNDMADPMNDLMTFADTMRMGRKTQALSLGRGIEATAIQMIQQAAERGTWVVLQNCHLCTGFMRRLELQVEELVENSGAVHRDFRLWLTSQPTTDFSVNILQNAVKISVENPNNLKANMLRVWENNVSEKLLQESLTSPDAIQRYKKLVYSLSLFYSVLLQRKKYGSIGFNTPYAWSNSDVGICFQQLPAFLSDDGNYNKAALLYLFAEINIGGCVTDGIDQRTVNAIVEDFLADGVENEGYVFAQGKQATSETPDYMLKQLKDGLQYGDYLDQIRETIPLECHPGNIGLNMNSNIVADNQESRSMLEEMLILQKTVIQSGATSSSSTESAAAESQEEKDARIIKQIQETVPKPFDIDAVTLAYPTKFEESLNSLLVQECGRYNVLIQTMNESLAELVRALKGLTVMSPELEALLQAVQMNRQPELFQRFSYPSLKPLSSYMADLNMRVGFLSNWIKNGKPRIYNIAMFFFAQGFLTSLLQNYARKYQVAIDTIDFKYAMTDVTIDDQKFVADGNKCSQESSLPAQDDGVFISGLYLEAAIYDIGKKVLCEARPRELYFKMPLIIFTPAVAGEGTTEDGYACPCYRTLARFGTLSTTGHSTNFMLYVQLPCEPGTARHWIKRSVALFASLSD